ncbi:hypothetical protein GCM10009837_15810 [Streptomyces durmitorensis]|uniref:Uncharacterized protein n=1 Tax=Streptomyces durmitorensis TaxID=319947 RepID=A0ABY4PQ34_9ACTN|nr:hypothetical protein [Streptomyces durmitorensis]UQT55706.1 hypothetical protein M4V62_11700 [Streptomyces durmitorensis]
MSQEAVPEQEAARETSVPEQGPPGLLQQMEELMAALNADLTQLDADLTQSTSAGDTTPPAPRPPAGDEPTRF